MDYKKIVQLRLFRKNMKPIESDDRYSNSFVTISNFKENISKLEQVINFLHQDLVWDGIPTIEEVEERLTFGSVCMLWKFENKKYKTYTTMCYDMSRYRCYSICIYLLRVIYIIT